MIVPYSKPVAHLYGQGSPVYGIQIDSSEQRIFSIGNDNTIKVSNNLGLN